MSIVQIRSTLDAPINRVDVSAYTIPTSHPESDGTLAWNSTTLIYVEVGAENKTGIGYTYASKASGKVISETLASELLGKSALDIPRLWEAMIRSVRNIGRPGVASTAISAVDIALWDLKAKLLDVPLVKLLGMSRDAVPIYGSGGFTSYSIEKLRDQLGGWKAEGFTKVKMKIGRHPEEDLKRIQAAREAIGNDCELYVDANGAYSRKQALGIAETFALFGVSWFEEPVSSDDLEGLKWVRDRVPPGMDIAAGEYGFDPVNFRRMLEAGAVDVLQVDITRCLGVTGFLRAAALSQAHFTDVSGHCAPSIHASIGCVIPNFRHLEYFYDHVRIEKMLFEGVVIPKEGVLKPDFSRPGLGLEFKKNQAKGYAA